MQWELIESDDALQAKLAQVEDSRVVMVDTEFMRRDTFFPQIALLQLCFVGSGEGEKTAWLIDPLKIEDTGPLIDLLENPDILKVLHSASEDLEVFSHWLGVTPQPMFDTQRAAALLNRGFGLGYGALVQEICDIDLPKGETRSNWLQRPLTESQCEYAGLDVTWLLPVWKDLHAQCEAQDKLQWVLDDGADAIVAMGSAQANFHKRIKTAWKLDSPALGRLIALSNWRERIARQKDKPRGWIIDDKACLQLAQIDPATLDELQDLADLPPPAVRRYGESLIEVLSQQREESVESLPEPLPAPLDAAQRDRLKKLKARARAVAADLAIAPEAALPSKDYELLLREAAGVSIEAPMAWQGWRAELVLSPLRQFLSSGD